MAADQLGRRFHPHRERDPLLLSEPALPPRSFLTETDASRSIQSSPARSLRRSHSLAALLNHLCCVISLRTPSPSPSFLPLLLPPSPPLSRARSALAQGGGSARQEVKRVMSERGKSHTLLHMQEQRIQEVSEQLCTAEVQDARVQTGCNNGAMAEGEAGDAPQQARISLHTCQSAL